MGSERSARLWIAALVVFVLAAMTGSIYRWGTVFGPPFGWKLGYIRHAHSHLMYMGWATPALMALLLKDLAGREGGQDRLRRPRRLAWLTLTGGLIAYIAFLWTGYDSVQIGPAQLPVAAIVAGLNVMIWYGFAALVWPVLETSLPTASTRMWMIGLAFLFISTLGAWGRGALPLLGISGGVWADLTVHLFLDLFAEGWLTFGVLAVAHARAAGSDPGWSAGTIFLAAGVLLMPLLSVAGSALPPAAVWAGRLGAVLVGVGVIWQAGVLWRRLRSAWRLPLGLLALKGLMLLGLVTMGRELSGMPGVRILYLHTSLLGFVTLGLVAAARDRWDGRAAPSMTALGIPVLLVLFSLVMLSGLWPWALGVISTLGFSLLVAPLPALVVGLSLLAAWSARAGGGEVL